MREIEFRGLRKDGKGWAYGFLDYRDTAFCIHEVGDISPTRENPGGDTYSEYHEVIPEIVGQFMGRKDKFGKKIFEGDIIRHERYIQFDNYEGGGYAGTVIRIGKCSWTPSRGLFFIGTMQYIDETNEPKNDTVKWRGSLTWLEDYAQIIGTIHETPEQKEER